MSSVSFLLMKASLCLEAAERPQWPRLYSFQVLRSYGTHSVTEITGLFRARIRLIQEQNKVYSGPEIRQIKTTT